MGKRRLFIDMPLRRKISLFFMVLYTVLVFAIVLVVNLIYRHLMDTQIQERFLYEERLMLQQLEKFTANINSCSNNVILSLNAGFRQFTGAPIFEGSSDYEVDRMFIAGIENNLMMFHEASRITVVLETGKLYTQNRANMRDSIGSNALLYTFLKDENVDTDGLWFYDLNQRFGLEAGEISYIKSLRDIQTNLGVGFVIVSVEPSSLQSLYRNPHMSEYTHYGIFSPEARRLTPIDENLAAEADIQQEIAGDKNHRTGGQMLFPYGEQYYLSNVSAGNKDEWTLICLIDRRLAMAGANMITFWILFVGGMIMIAASFIISFIAKRISEPIRVMADHMIRFQNGLPNELPIYSSQDEIGTLTENFNQMIRRNRDLFRNVIEEQNQKRHFELALLQAQIKPHFLYNTLDTAYCLTDDGQAQDAKTILKLLADYYRAVLNKGSEWISVSRELDSVQRYLEIQKMRYGDLFDFEVAVSEEILPLQIPKLTIQPLVENAIYHGIKPKGRDGRIRISGDLEDNWARIWIWDNGIGLDPKTFHSLLEEETADGNSFGLKNSNDRLQLFYGEKSRLRLEACESGTCVCINIFLGLEEDNV